MVPPAHCLVCPLERRSTREPVESWALGWGAFMRVHMDTPAGLHVLSCRSYVHAGTGTPPCSRAVTFPLLPPAEALAFSCFTELMKRMNQNFPHGGAMDTHFANMRSLIQVRGPRSGSDGGLLGLAGTSVAGLGGRGVEAEPWGVQGGPAGEDSRGEHDGCTEEWEKARGAAGRGGASGGIASTQWVLGSLLVFWDRSWTRSSSS